MLKLLRVALATAGAAGVVILATQVPDTTANIVCGAFAGYAVGRALVEALRL